MASILAEGLVAYEGKGQEAQRTWPGDNGPGLFIHIE